MRPRRGFHERLRDSITIDGGDFADVIYGLAWLITALANVWPS